VKRSRVGVLGVVAVAAAAVFVGPAVAGAQPGGSTGPSSSQSPYLVRSQPGVGLKSIVTVGDAVPKVGGGSYRMVGIPDGLGAFDNGDGTFTVLMNHELPPGVGAVRAHGAAGAFVSKWVVRKDDLTVVAAEDLIKQVATWNTATSSYNPPASGVVIGRLCSADLPARSALYNAATGNGYDGHIFMDGEEVGVEGRAFAHLLSGTSYELPALGKMSFENSVANPATGDKTVVVGLDDSTPGQVYVYVGDKKSAGSAVDRAGLTGGTLYGVKVSGFPDEPATGIPFGTAFTGHSFGDVSAWTGAQLETASDAAGVTRFLRPEDGAWDPSNPSDFYFVTTASFTGPSRLWRLHFTDPANPAAGGTISMMLEGTETGGTPERYHMLDNLTMNGRGQLVLQEDPGNQPYLARVWLYDVASDTLTQVAEHDPARFAPPTPPPFTQDEESSGVIDASGVLGTGWYLLDIQAHYPNPDPELVEGGQLLAMHVPAGKFPKHGGGS
jgi:Bacterial protein of unknown function (DUF839)